MLRPPVPVFSVAVVALLAFLLPETGSGLSHNAARESFAPSPAAPGQHQVSLGLVSAPRRWMEQRQLRGNLKSFVQAWAAAPAAAEEPVLVVNTTNATANATETTTTTTTTTTTLPLPPCNATEDQFGILRPANCTTNNVTGNVTCVRIDEYPEDICQRPLEKECPDLDNLGMVKDYYKVWGSGHAHGTFRNITCQDEASPTEKAYDVMTWAKWWYKGPRFTNSTCNNGTWTFIQPINMAVMKPERLTCFTNEQIQLLKDTIHYRNVTLKDLRATEKIPFPWIDASANLRKDSLKFAQGHAWRMYMEALEGNMATADDFRKVIQAMKDNYILHRGDTYNQSACDNMANHFMWQLKNKGPGKFANNKQIPPPSPEGGYPTYKDVDLEKPVPLTCRYTAHKTSLGWDFVNAGPIMYYRDGCMCESKWTGGCPFDLNLAPTYKQFGFDSLEKKIVSDGLGTPQPNALCWYWSAPTYPENGYLGWDLPGGTAYQAPAKDGFDRLMEHNDKKKAARGE